MALLKLRSLIEFFQFHFGEREPWVVRAKWEKYACEGEIYCVYMWKWSLISVATRISWCRHVFVVRLTSATERFVNAFGSTIFSRAQMPLDISTHTETACCIKTLGAVFPSMHSSNGRGQRTRRIINVLNVFTCVPLILSHVSWSF